MPNIEIFGLNNKATPVGTDEIEGQETGGGSSVKMTLASVISSLVAGVYQPFSSVLAATTAAFTTALKTKLDGVETGATTDQTPGEIKTAYESNANTNEFSDAEQTKLGGIETLADVTDTANVTSAGALMDSEVDADLKTFALPASTTISTFGATLIDDADAASARTTLGAGTGDGDVTAAGNIDDRAIVIGEGGVKGVRPTGITVTPTDTVYGANAEIVNKTAAYEFVSGDEGKSFTMDGAFDFTIPANASVAFPIGTFFNLHNIGGDSVSVVLTSDTLLPAASPTGVTTVATVKKTAVTTWMIYGDLA
jgi:hypothetical protein